MTFNKLYKTILSRQDANAYDSYVADLFRQGADRIIQKVGEESVEVTIAAKNIDRKRQIEEISDLLFHLLVLLVSLNIPLSAIWKELSNRSIKKDA